PGYFAADGDAANSSASSGTVWRAHFNPPSEGTWTYEASFREGNNVAVSLNPAAGQSAGHFDGASGSFDVAPTNKDGLDLRSKGLLSYDGDQYLNFAGDGSTFLKSGVGSPENLLGYSGFDNTPDNHDYAPHIGDYNNGDPSWGNGEGEGIIGAVNYLAEHGVNSAYMMLMNIGGDGRDVSPWSSDDVFDIAKNAGTNNGSFNLTVDARSFDVSKLDQWEIVFEHMQKNGITLHLFLQETENDFLLNDGELGLERQLFIREMVARFGHHNGIIWNLGEENTNTLDQLRDHSSYLKAVDGYDHPVALHTFPGNNNYSKYYEGLAGEGVIDVLSIQTGNQTQDFDFDRYLGAGESEGRPYVAFYDEPGDASYGLKAVGDPGWQQNHADLRDVLWTGYLEGGSGAEWYFGYQSANRQGGDLEMEDFSLRESAYEWAAAAREFFEALPLDEMVDADALTTGTNGSDEVLAKEGEVYAIYLRDGGSATLDLGGVSGNFAVRWYDVIDGTYHEGSVTSVSGGGKVSLGQAPNDPNGEWAILVQSDGTAPPPDPDPEPPVADGDPVYLMEDGRVVMQAETGVFLIDGAAGNDTW
ncbi:MAG: hypothetical protein AAF698_07420, partial [Pseudomonadota bacterium]